MAALGDYAAQQPVGGLGWLTGKDNTERNRRRRGPPYRLKVQNSLKVTKGWKGGRRSSMWPRRR